MNKLEWQRNHRKKTKNLDTNKYEKTISGFLMRKYRNMKSRVTGIQKLKQHLYSNMGILPKEEFYSWSKSSKDFHHLYTKWVESGYSRKLCPSVDRIDSSKGYTKDNIQWITHSENSSKGAISKHASRCHS